MPGPYKGKKLVLKVGPQGSEVLVGVSTDFTVNRESELIQVSHKESEKPLVLPDLKRATISISGLYVPEDQGQDALKDAFEGQTPVRAVVYLDGIPEVTFPKMFIKSLVLKAPTEGAVTYDIDLVESA